MCLGVASIPTISFQSGHQEGGLGTCVADELHAALEDGHETRDSLWRSGSRVPRDCESVLAWHLAQFS